MKKISIFAPVALALAVSLSGFSQAKEELAGVVETGAQPELVQEGFMFTEGPVGTTDGGLYFTDIRANKIYLLELTGKIRTVRENSQGANGLALNSSELYAAEGTSKLISRGNQNGRNTTVIDSANG